MTLDKETIEKLILYAYAGRKNSYSPYSHFAVGAAVLVGNPKEEQLEIFTGCNIENASYPAGNCAERTAIYKAVSVGYNQLKAVAIVAGPDSKTGLEDNSLSDASFVLEDYVSPCGICRQVMREFSDPKELVIIMAKSVEDYKVMTLEELLPMSFGPENLN